MKNSLLLLMLPLIALSSATPAAAVMLDAGNANYTAPADDPGWDYVGWLGLNGVYVGYGWVLTAGHVAVTPGKELTLDGVAYPVIPESRVVFEHSPGTDADLAAFRIDPYPTHLLPLPIRATTPAEDTEAVMIGRGRNRASASTWGPGGWNLDVTGPKRWGKNFIGGDIAFWPGTSTSIAMGYGATLTQSLVLEFNDALNPATDPDPDPSPLQPLSADEAIVTEGDSGGGLFIFDDASDVWELAGIAWLVTRLNGQPADTAIYGNDALYVDLSAYHEAVLAVVRPCDDGIDNDGDGNADLADDDCLWAGDMSELPACSDGIDNDYDGNTDLADGDCAAADGQLEEPDQDGDLVPDASDNCTERANSDQNDKDHDGYGNLCDADLNNDGGVTGADLGIMMSHWGSVSSEGDVDGDGVVTGMDIALMMAMWGHRPGPSSLACAGTVPCP
ncbi:MAG: hypothetical protein JRH16_16755 [Deltaproteobacteria bacterium]|nr:hypothetical protein [Deltaproteobacteria bacterium]